MERSRKGVWMLVGVGAGVLTAAGIYFLIRSFKKGPSNANIQKVEAIIREAEDLIKHHK